MFTNNTTLDVSMNLFPAYLTKMKQAFLILDALSLFSRCPSIALCLDVDNGIETFVLSKNNRGFMLDYKGGQKYGVISNEERDIFGEEELIGISFISFEELSNSEKLIMGL